jgi:hypothetical protein
MPRNGTGTYVPPASSWVPAVNGVNATAADWNALQVDLTAAVTQSVSKDGQTPMTGNLPMGNNKITGLATGTANTDAANVGQLPSFDVWNSGLVTVVPSAGAFTDANAVLHYKANGKTVAFSVVVNLILNGTGTGTILVVMPWTALSESAFGGRESQTSGFAVAGTMAAGSATLTIVKYDNTYPGANNHRIAINGVMETT